MMRMKRLLVRISLVCYVIWCEELHIVKTGKDKKLLDELNKDTAFDAPLQNNTRNNDPFQVWDHKTCNDVVHLFSVTGKAIQRIKGEMRAKENTKDPATQLKVKALQMLTEELIESERWIFSALHRLKETVKSSAANSLDRIVLNTRSRVEELQYATLREEEKCDALGEILFQIKDINLGSENHNIFYDLIEDVLSDVESAADKLEENLRDKLAPIKARDIETVKKLNDGVTSQNLEDIHGNRYVISLPADKTQPLTDPTLLFSLLTIVFGAGVLSTLCHLVSIPTIFGQILCGVILGPSCLNLILDPVQTETIGEIGVFLILFCCGLEFSADSLIKVWRISVGGSISIIVLITVAFTICGSIFNISASQSIFVALCLSFSSTALIIKFLHDDKSDDVRELRDSMLSMLVLQDIEISLIMGLLPLLAQHSPHHLKHLLPHVHIRKLLSVPDQQTGFDKGTVVIVAVFAVLSGCLVVMLGRRFMLVCGRFLNRTSNLEVETLLPLSLCFGVVLIAGHMGVSMEVGCFVSGVLVKSLNRGEETLKLLGPVRDIFAVLFFSAIGLHVYPLFVWSQLNLIIVLTFFVVSIKYLVCLLVLQHLASDLQRSVISAGLAQVSEFSFVLASRGRKLQLINREVYLLILSITAASLIISPLIWKTSLIHARRKKDIIPHLS